MANENILRAGTAVEERERNPALRPETSGFKIPYLRWWIISLIFLVTLINFLDRLTISVLAPVIRASLHLTNLQYATLGTWFLIFYTASHVLSGKLYDRIGTRLGFVCSVVVWSLAAMLHATARGLASLNIFRSLLGLGEAGNWPGAAKVTAEWFPTRERALALAVFNSGTSLGSVFAPPLIIWLQFQFGWQATFFIIGSLGFLWLPFWLIFYRKPTEHPWLTSRERKLIEDGLVEAKREDPPSPAWTRLLGYRQVWAIVFARFVVDPVWWLYIFWLPEYLNKVRGFSLARIGRLAWMPYVAAGVGGVVGGYLAGLLIHRGWTVDRARKIVLLVAAAMMPAGILAVRASNPILALVFIGIVLFGFQAWINNVQSLPADLFPNNAVGSVAGMGGASAGIGSMLFILATGWTVDHFSYTPVLTAAGVLAPIGFIVFMLLIGKIQKLGVASTK